MKRLFLALTMLVAMVATASAQAEIKFDKVVHNFGNFSEKSPVQKTTFTFTNVGKKGTITVTYNGKGMFPGHFKKSITVRSNGNVEMTRLYIEGVMTEETKQ